MDVAHARRHTAHVIDAVGEELYGLETVIKLSLAALLSGGHVLLEGNPGLGKTELVKRLAQVLNLKAGRIQFTPDLMPADITGTLMPTGNGGLRFQSGPIFTSLLLADEINRATPKTQSAMLEAMAEKKVTVLGEAHALPSPFVVLATQNPIDHEGTYNLPAAQADRFMFKVRMPVPDGPTVKRIVRKRAGAGAPGPQAESGNGSKAGPGSYDLPGDAHEAEALVRELDAEFEKKPLAEWSAAFDGEDVWWAPVQTISEALEDPAVRANGVVVKVPGGEGGDAVEMVATPVDFYGTPWTPQGPVPELGQHTEEVLLEMGYEWEQIAALKEQGAIP